MKSKIIFDFIFSFNKKYYSWSLSDNFGWCMNVLQFYYENLCTPPSGYLISWKTQYERIVISRKTGPFSIDVLTAFVTHCSISSTPAIYTRCEETKIWTCFNHKNVRKFSANINFLFFSNPEDDVPFSPHIFSHFSDRLPLPSSVGTGFFVRSLVNMKKIYIIVPK